MAELFRLRDGGHPIEANQLLPEVAEAVALWCNGILVQEHDAIKHEKTYVGINVPTSIGMKRAQEGDWIIRRPTGDFVPVKPGRFEELFEAVVDG